MYLKASKLTWKGFLDRRSHNFVHSWNLLLPCLLWNFSLFTMSASRVPASSSRPTEIKNSIKSSESSLSSLRYRLQTRMAVSAGIPGCWINFRYNFQILMCWVTGKALRARSKACLHLVTYKHKSAFIVLYKNTVLESRLICSWTANWASIVFRIHVCLIVRCVKIQTFAGKFARVEFPEGSVD